MTIESEIFIELKVILNDGLTWVRHIEQFNPFPVEALTNDKLPLVQYFWDEQSTQQQERGVTTTTASMLIEIVAKNTPDNDMTQEKIFQYRSDVLDIISANASLPSVSGFIQFSYEGRTYDVHSNKDYYVAQLRFSALFQEPYGSC